MDSKAKEAFLKTGQRSVHKILSITQHSERKEKTSRIRQEAIFSTSAYQIE